MAFEKYIPNESVYGQRSTSKLTLSQGKFAIISVEAVREFELSGCKRAILYWDAAKKAIGIEASDGPDSVKTTLIRGRLHINCRDFLKKTGLTETVRAAMKHDPKTGLLVAVFGDQDK